jgi:tetratricopeptide (TPR) repeat protein
MPAFAFTYRSEETGLDDPIRPSQRRRILRIAAPLLCTAFALLIVSGCAARSAAVLNRTGLEQYRHEQYDQSYKSFSEAIALSPSSADLYYNRAGAAEKLARLRDADADFTKAIEIEPEYVDAYRSRADLSFSRRRFESSRADWSFVISLASADAEAYCGRARALERLDRTDEALADFDRAVLLSPGDSGVLISRGQFYFRTARYDRALADLTSAAALSPKSPEAYLCRGMLYEYGMSRPGEALTDYTRAVELSPNDARALNYRANLLRKLGMTKEALADFAAICRMGYPFGCWQYDWLTDETR